MTEHVPLDETHHSEHERQPESGDIQGDAPSTGNPRRVSGHDLAMDRLRRASGSERSGRAGHQPAEGQKRATGSGHQTISETSSQPDSHHVPPSDPVVVPANSEGERTTATAISAPDRDTEPLARAGAERQANVRSLLVAAVAVGTISGLNRWAIRRLTGTDLKILGPSRIRPMILGTGLATLIGSLYLNDD